MSNYDKEVFTKKRNQKIPDLALRYCTDLEILLVNNTKKQKTRRSTLFYCLYLCYIIILNNIFLYMLKYYNKQE